MTYKTLGVIGGMGPLATQVFFKGVIEQTDAQCDQEHVPMLILNHTAMPDRTQAILAGGAAAERVQRLLCEDARMLEQNGAEAIAIPCNTSHYFWPGIQQAVSIPVIHMIRETVAHIQRTNPGVQRVGILATDGTIATELYQNECRAVGIEPVIPSPPGQAVVMNLIYSEIKKGKSGDYDAFLQVERELKDQGAEVAILACTELSCFKEQHSLHRFYVDALDVLIARSIDASGARRKGRL